MELVLAVAQLILLTFCINHRNSKLEWRHCNYSHTEELKPNNCRGPSYTIRNNISALSNCCRLRINNSTTPEFVHLTSNYIFGKAGVNPSVWLFEITWQDAGKTASQRLAVHENTFCHVGFGLHLSFHDVMVVYLLLWC